MIIQPSFIEFRNILLNASIIRNQFTSNILKNYKLKKIKNDDCKRIYQYQHDFLNKKEKTFFRLSFILINN